MKVKITIIAIAVSLGILNWLLTSYVESIAYDKSYLSSLVYAKSDWIFIYRFFMMILFLSFAVYLIKFLNKRKRIESELFRFKTAADTSGEVIFMTDTVGIIKYINPEFTNVYGYSKEEVINKTTPRILKSGVMNEMEYKYFWDTIVNGNIVKGELINKHKNGSLITIEGSANPVYDENGEIVAYLAIQRDISERKASEELLVESEKLYRALLNAPDDPVYLINTDGIILSINEAAINLIGKSAESLVAESIYDFSTVNKLFDKKDKVNEVIKKQGAITFKVESKKEFYESTIYPLFDINGKVNRLAVFEKNISKLEKSKVQLKEKNKFLYDVLEALPHPFYVIDVKDYSIILANSATKNELYYDGIKCHKLTHKNDHPCSGKDHDCPLEKVLQSKKAYITEHIHYNEKNEARNIEVYAYPIFNEKNEVVQMIEYALDITERKKAEEAIKKLNIKID